MHACMYVYDYIIRITHNNMLITSKHACNYNHSNNTVKYTTTLYTPKLVEGM